jgi:hypothetical protein
MDRYQFRNVRLVQAYGDAPNELNTTTLPSAPNDLSVDSNPHQRIVKIVPNPFAGQHSGKFRVLRAAGGGPHWK